MWACSGDRQDRQARVAKCARRPRRIQLGKARADSCATRVRRWQPELMRDNHCSAASQLVIADQFNAAALESLPGPRRRQNLQFLSARLAEARTYLVEVGIVVARMANELPGALR